MANLDKDADPATEALPGVRFDWGARISPHVIVLLLMCFAAIPPLKGVIVSGVYAWWDKTYAKVDYVMDTAEPNAGSPFIAGHIDGSAGQHNLLGQMRGSTMVVKALPQEAFEPGKRIAIWHSDEAPNFVAFGEEVNDVPVAAVPKRPGVASFLVHLVWLLATFVVGFAVMAWVAKRWTRNYGTLPIRRHAGHTIRY